MGEVKTNDNTEKEKFKSKIPAPTVDQIISDRITQVFITSFCYSRNRNATPYVTILYLSYSWLISIGLLIPPECIYHLVQRSSTISISKKSSSPSMLSYNHITPVVRHQINNSLVFIGFLFEEL